MVMSHNIGRQHNSYVYGNAFEAFIGAIYLDRGYEKCRKFLLTRVFDKIVNVEKTAISEVNFKSRLIELSQKRHIPVEFKLINEQNDANGQFFVSEVYVGNELFGKGSGYSKRESQQKAAKAALEKLTKDKWNEIAERESMQPTCHDGRPTDDAVPPSPSQTSDIF